MKSCYGKVRDPTRPGDADACADSLVRSLEQEEKIAGGNMGEGKEGKDGEKLHRTCCGEGLEEAVKYVGRREMQSCCQCGEQK